MTVERLVERWGLQAEAGAIHTSTSTIQFVRRGTTPCVLKIPRDGADEATVAALSHFGGRGAVALLAHDGPAVLMQRAVPGTPLSDLVIAGRDDEATRVLCRTMTALHAGGAAPQGFRCVEDWGAAFGRPAASELPVGLVDTASRLYAELCASQGSRVVLHGDLHHDNVLFDDRLGWCAIDPKGIIGEPEFEIGAALRNPHDPRYFAAPGIIDRRVRIVCETLGWNRDRVLRWCFAQAVLSAIWSIEDDNEPVPWLAVATSTLAMI